MLRDEPAGGDQIPEEFDPGDYHLKALDKTRCDLASLDAMTPDELEAAAFKEWRSAEDYRLERLQEMRSLRAAYEAMLKRVKAWTPPTPEHSGLHEFMRTQIEDSIPFDCDTDYYDNPTVKMTGEDWKAVRHRKLLADLTYHANHHEADVERAAGQTAWVRALRESL